MTGHAIRSSEQAYLAAPLRLGQRLSLPFIRAASRLGLLGAYGFFRQHLAKPSARIIAYHRVGGTYEFPSDVPLIPPEDFEKQVSYLSRNYRVISLSELGRALSRGTGLPAKAAVITFDDGYKDNHAIAYPILKRHGVPATVFLATGHIDTGTPFWWDRVSYAVHHSSRENLDMAPFGTYHFRTTKERWLAARTIREGLKDLSDGHKNSVIEELVGKLGVDMPLSLARDMFLSWDEVREMSHNGTEFGAHTVNHPTLIGMPLEQAREEIVGSQRRIQEELGRPAETFAYPDGRFSNITDGIKAILRENGFVCAVYGTPDALVCPGTDPYEMGRLSPRWDFSTFQLSVSGLYPDLMALSRRLRTP